MHVQETQKCIKFFVGQMEGPLQAGCNCSLQKMNIQEYLVTLLQLT